MKEEYHQWNSLYLNRDFDMLVFGHHGFPVVLFPPEKGRYYDAKDAGLIHSAEQFLESGIIKIYCPDSVDKDSWFNYSIKPSDRVKTHNGYENLIINDVIAFAEHETGYKNVLLAGCGLGGYHAINLAFRHPHLVNAIISMGGLMDIKRFIWGYYDDNCYFNNPVDYLPGLNDSWYLERISKMNIIMGAGENDPYLSENLIMSEILNSKGIKNKLDIIPGISGNLKEWNELFPEYLSQINFG